MPARDLAQSKAFYAALGFEVPWASGNLAYVRHGSTSFLLQEHFVPDHANNFMMHLLVENVDDWYEHIVASGAVEKFGARIEPPEDRSWGLRDFPLIDPSGVLWRIGQNIAKAS